MNYKKGFVIPLIIAIVAILAIGGGYFMFSKNIKPCSKINVGFRNTETGLCQNFSSCGDIPKKFVSDSSCLATSTATTTDIIAGWKTYTNTQYGFTLKYPNNWRIVDTKGGPIVSVAPDDYIFKDGTDSPFGYFFVWPFGFNLSDKSKQERLEKPLDTGWIDEPLLGNYREVITNDKKLEIIMLGPITDIQEKILETFIINN